MGLLFREAGIPFRAVHCDTGWEHEVTETYVRDYLPAVLGVEVEVIQSHLGGMEEIVRKRAMFPNRVRRFCTQELKVRPLIRYLKALDADHINIVGIRAGESESRAKMPEWEWSDSFDCDVWRPLIRWTTADVINMHHRHDARPNPLYLKGATRVGCWPCIFARKKELRLISDIDPKRIDRLRELETEVGVDAANRAEARGEEIPRPPTWFQDPTSRADATGHRGGACWPIDDVIRWARTKRGGKEEELLAPPYAEEGCMRWGLCETDEPDANGQGLLPFGV